MNKIEFLIKIAALSISATLLLTACNIGKTVTPSQTDKNKDTSSNSSSTSFDSELSSSDSSSDSSSTTEGNSGESTTAYDDDDGSIQKRPWQTYKSSGFSFTNNSVSSNSSSSTSGGNTSSNGSETVTEKCPYTKEQLIQMLKYLTFDEADRYAVGVGCGELYVTSQTNTFTTKFGGAPVTYDFEMSCLPYDKATDRQLERTVNEMLEFTKKGGIIGATDHWLTPTIKLSDSTQSGANNSREKLTRTQYYQVMTPGNQLYDNFREELAISAAFFQRLKDVGIPVIFRPMHEANGGWFWWGVGSSKGITGADVAALYRYVHDYFVKEKGLDNIIWCYCTGLAGNSSERYTWWPGDEYVDIATTDWYLVYGDYEGYYNDAQNLVGGIPFALSEYGGDGNYPVNEHYISETLGYLDARIAKGAKCAYVGLYFNFEDIPDEYAPLTDKCITLDMMPSLWQKIIK